MNRRGFLGSLLALPLALKTVPSMRFRATYPATITPLQSFAHSDYGLWFEVTEEVLEDAHVDIANVLATEWRRVSERHAFRMFEDGR